MRLRWLLLFVALGIAPAHAQVVHVLAAGSLDGAFADLLAAFKAPPGSLAVTYGPSGVLRQRVEAGEPADMLASADMAQPRRLAQAGKGWPVVMFARNRMCVLARAKLGMTPDSMLTQLLDPAVRLATSTPGADPGGDYAWAVFAKAEAVHPGAQAALQAKALKLVGGPDSKPLVPGHGQVAGVFLADRADAMLGYCSGSDPVMQEVPGLVSVPVPPALSVGPAYGLTVLSDKPLAARFALFVMSEPGQAILARYGFDPVARP